MATAKATTLAEPDESTADAEGSRRGLERARMILTELADAARSAAGSIADQQKARLAAQVGDVATAVRAAARSFEGSQSPLAADYADRAAERIEAVADTIRRRPWGEFAAEVESTARHQPALFVAGAVALGFLAGRFWAGARRVEPAATGPPASVAAEAVVTAAVSSGGGNGRPADRPSASGARDLA